MTELDYSAFTDIVHRFSRVFRPPAPVEQLVPEYWRALETLSYLAVEQGAEKWLASGTRFPKPIEWIESCPRWFATSEDLPVATPSERRAYLDAKAAGWEWDPCNCPECVAACVSDRPTRFVPIQDADGRDDRAYVDASRSEVFIRGEWLHGERLASWYRARAEFWNRYHEVLGTGGARPLREREAE